VGSSFESKIFLHSKPGVCRNTWRISKTVGEAVEEKIPSKPNKSLWDAAQYVVFFNHRL